MHGRTQPPAEIHIVAAPTEAFLLRVQLLAASIRRNAGAFASSRIVVTLSRDCEPWDIGAAYGWSRDLDIEWRWVPEEVWQKHGIYGSALARFLWPVAAPYVVHLDADTLVTGPLDDLPQLTGDTFGGVVAHVAPSAFLPPFADGRVHEGVAYWARLHEAAGLELPPLTSEHTGWGVMDVDADRRWCPPYYNLGLLAGTADVMASVGGHVLTQLATVESEITTHFRCQLAVMLALTASGVASTDLSVAWNLPNDERFRAAHPLAAAEPRLLHYLRVGEFDRERDTSSLSALDAFLARELAEPTNRTMQMHMRELRPQLGDTAVRRGAQSSALVLRAQVENVSDAVVVIDASGQVTTEARVA
ncbi:MAG: hypothetical protein JWN41_427 [Thermoleophilia bacterium]|nr:hypothetical protein [Thermoleophilia bacterium]